MHRRYLIAAGTLLLLAGAIAACAPAPVPTEPAGTPTPEGPPVMPLEVPFEEAWGGSAHADASAEAFRHWDEEDPQVVPASCTKCHSTPGYQDFLGLDGSAYSSVENDTPIGTVIACVACHNEVTMTMDSVVMPSGLEITGLGREARCMQCHQGRESTVSVNAAIEEVGVEADVVSADLRFRNIHYYAAAATKYGTLAQGGYQYEGRAYDANFAHVEEFDTCIECHNVHTLEVRVAECAGCHTDVSTLEDLKDIRMNGSLVDYDGDGDDEEGMYYEIVGVQEKLYQGIQAYAQETAGTSVVYDAARYPYFFADPNTDGTIDEGEEGFAALTPRLLKAAYNYHVSQKDPGMFAHGGKYIIQLLFDSLEDLNAVLSNPVAMDSMHRIDDGHFAGSEEAFRHWDEDGEVPGSCSRCHSAGGLPMYLKEGVTISQPPANGFKCTTCHESLPEFTRYQVEQVTFPSGARVAFENLDANLCLTCHQGRESTLSVNAAIARADVGDDVVSDALSFRNPHYFAAGATLFGGDVQGAYQYAGRTYLGRFLHVEPFNTCVNCHSTHRLDVQIEACSGCHPSVTDEESLRTIRGPNSTGIDYDGDGDAEEGIGQEVATMEEALLAAIQEYAADQHSPIAYDGHAYPYFFADPNANGAVDEGEGRYESWTPRLLRAAYNYQWVAKDPGAFAHNGKYILQVLYDSLRDLGASVSGMVRP